MKLKVRTYAADNMFFGPAARYAAVEDEKGNTVKDCSPPCARLQAWWYVICHLGGK